MRYLYTMLLCASQRIAEIVRARVNVCLLYRERGHAQLFHQLSMPVVMEALGYSECRLDTQGHRGAPNIPCMKQLPVC